MTERRPADPERVQRILEERARRLARPAAPQRPADVLEVVSFQLAGERYAIAAERVREVFRLQGRSALPGAPDPIAGVTAHRGEILTLLDVRSILGLSSAALNDLGRVLVLEHGRTHVGILVDRVEGVEEVPRAELRPPLPLGPAAREHLVGVTGDALIVLDVDVLLRLFDGGGDS